MQKSELEQSCLNFETYALLKFLREMKYSIYIFRKFQSRPEKHALYKCYKRRVILHDWQKYSKDFRRKWDYK